MERATLPGLMHCLTLSLSLVRAAVAAHQPERGARRWAGREDCWETFCHPTCPWGHCVEWAAPIGPGPCPCQPGGSRPLREDCAGLCGGKGDPSPSGPLSQHHGEASGDDRCRWCCQAQVSGLRGEVFAGLLSASEPDQVEVFRATGLLSAAGPHQCEVRGAIR